MPSLQNYLMGLGGLLSISYQLQARSVHVLSMCCTFLFVQATKPCSALHPRTQLSPKISCTAHGWVHFGLPSPQPHLPPQCASSPSAQPKIPSLSPALHHHNLPGSQLHCPFTRALHRLCFSPSSPPERERKKKRKTFDLDQLPPSSSDLSLEGKGKHRKANNLCSFLEI